MNTNEVAQEMIAKTYQELAAASRPKQDSRNWKDPEGYRDLLPWSNAVLLRHLVRVTTSSLPPKEFRRKTQLDDAARSMVRNIEEGFKRPTTKEYLDFLGFSQASLEEVKGDTRELTDDDFLASRPGSSLASIGIDLGAFHEALLRENKGGYGKVEASNLSAKYAYHPLTILYPPLKSITAKDLSYEAFLELINKTDYLLRLLVKSLETKMNRDGKYYLIEREKIRQKYRGK